MMSKPKQKLNFEKLCNSHFEQIIKTYDFKMIHSYFKWPNYKIFYYNTKIYILIEYDAREDYISVVLCTDQCVSNQFDVKLKLNNYVIINNKSFHNRTKEKNIFRVFFNKINIEKELTAYSNELFTNYSKYVDQILSI